MTNILHKLLLLTYIWLSDETCLYLIIWWNLPISDYLMKLASLVILCGRRTKAHRTKAHTLIFKKEDKSPHIYFIRRTKAHIQILQGGQKPTHQIIEKGQNTTPHVSKIFHRKRKKMILESMFDTESFRNKYLS